MVSQRAPGAVKNPDIEPEMPEAGRFSDVLVPAVDLAELAVGLRN